MDARRLVFGDGDRFCGFGRLVHTAGGDWFDPPLPEPAVAYLNGRPAPTASPLATRVEAGADFANLERRYERDGAVEGFAMVYGVWDRGRILIDRLTADRRRHSYPRWSEPPCPAPPGGWPIGPLALHEVDLALGDLTATGAATAVVIFRPSEEHEVLVVAVSDSAAVESRLRPHLGRRLCVVPSRWTNRQLDEVDEHVTISHEEWRVYSWGRGCDEHGQTHFRIETVRVTGVIAEWVASLPDGLVALDPCLVPEHLSSRYLAGDLAHRE
jgi:hypothetical protein